MSPKQMTMMMSRRMMDQMMKMILEQGMRAGAGDVVLSPWMCRVVGKMMKVSSDFFTP